MGSHAPPGGPPKARAGPPCRRWSHTLVITIGLLLPAAIMSEVSSIEHGEGKRLSETRTVGGVLPSFSHGAQEVSGSLAKVHVLLL